MQRNGPLAGLRVLVTRPRERATEFAERLAALGATPLLLPAIDFEPLPVREVRARLDALGEVPDIVVFNSPAAVDHGLPLLPLPDDDHVTVAAIGPATADRLTAHGVHADILPDAGMDSEALLAMPALAADRIAQTRIWIVRGVGGRTLLADTLGARGAQVDTVEVYRRVIPRDTDSAIAGECDIVTVTSGETAHNLLAMLPSALRTRVCSRPAVAASARVAAELRELGFTDNIAVADGADAASMAEAVRLLAKPDRGSADSE